MFIYMGIINSIKKIFEKQLKIDWDSYINKTFVLHLPERKDRRRRLRRQLKAVKLSTGTLLDRVYWLEGTTSVDKNLSIHQPLYSFNYHWQIDPDENLRFMLDENPTIYCSMPEQAIAHSHYHILKHIVDNKIPVSLIMEDDVVLKYGFQKDIKSIFEKELPEDWDLLYLSSQPAWSGWKWEPYSENLDRVYNGIWWMSGYVITYEGAKKLLENLPIIGPVDVWINHQFKHLKVYMTSDNIIDQRQNNFREWSDNRYSFPETFDYFEV